MTGAQSAWDILTSLNVQRFARSIICCISDPAYPEPTDVLLEKAKKLNPDKTIDPAKFGAVYGTNRFLVEGPRSGYTPTSGANSLSC